MDNKYIFICSSDDYYTCIYFITTSEEKAVDYCIKNKKPELHIFRDGQSEHESTEFNMRLFYMDCYSNYDMLWYIDLADKLGLQILKNKLEELQKEYLKRFKDEKFDDSDEFNYWDAIKYYKENGFSDDDSEDLAYKDLITEFRKECKKLGL